MPLFHYQGLDKEGRSVRGSLVVGTESSLEERLRAMGCWLLEAHPEVRTPATRGESRRASWLRMPGAGKRRDLIEFCTLMSFLSRVGIPLLQALQVAMHDCDNERFRRLLKQISTEVEAGVQLHEALAKHPGTFSGSFTSLIRAGEMSGRLPDTFEDLRVYLEWVDKIIADVRQASIYPCIVLGVVAAFVLYLFSFIIPKFAELLAETNAPLPLLSQVVFGISDFAKQTWWMWLGGFLSAVIVVFVGRRVSDAFATAYDRLKLNLPVFGPLNLMLAMSRFSHNLSTLYRSGINIIEALKLCEKRVGNKVVEKAVVEVGEGLEAGRTISEAVRDQPIFPPILLRMVLTGESSGNLDLALQNVSDYYDQVVPRKIKKIFTIMEPALTLFLIGVVGAVALAVYLPILALMSAIQQR